VHASDKRGEILRKQFCWAVRNVLLTAVVLASADFGASQNDPFQVVHGWPELPEGFAFGQVSGVGVDAHNHVFVFHRGDRPVMMFDGATGKLLTSWGDGMFGSAHGLTVDHHNNIWLTDTREHLVFKFTHDGEQLMVLGKKGVPGQGPDHFNGPTDVAVATNGVFYVSDGYGNNRVAKFGPDGHFLLDWGRKGTGSGEFNLPHGIALDGQGKVYVADRSNSRVQIFDGEGKFLFEWKSEGLGKPWNIEIGRDGFAYVVDGGDVVDPCRPCRQWAVRLDLRGRILDKWGSFGSYDGQFYWAHDIAVAPDGAVYVADVYLGMRVQKFLRKAR
jgi:peptidylamidoglycolate lyase